MESFRSHLLFSGLLAALFLGSSSWIGSAGDDQDPAVKPVPQDKAQFVGAAKCKNCHNAKEKGEIYDKWLAGPHAKAFDVLASPEAKAYGQARGIADPQKAPECLKCHVTAHGADPKKISKSLSAKDGINCETCHGPGGEHMKIRMKAAMTGGPKDAGTTAAGFPIPLEVPPGEISLPTEKTCLGCHNAESPGFKEFHLELRLPVIRHVSPGRSGPRWVAKGEKEAAAASDG